jgi:hypothetical protein
MSTFDAISQIRRQALSQPQALRYLIESFGFTVTYAREVISAVFGDESAPGPASIRTVDRPLR